VVRGTVFLCGILAVIGRKGEQAGLRCWGMAGFWGGSAGSGRVVGVSCGRSGSFGGYFSGRVDSAGSLAVCVFFW
jgi:hypothetical protein